MLSKPELHLHVKEDNLPLARDPARRTHDLLARRTTISHLSGVHAAVVIFNAYAVLERLAL